MFKKNKFKIIFLIIFFAFLISLCSLQSQWLMKNEYELWTLKQHWLEIEKNNKEISIEVAKLEALKRIHEIASKNENKIVDAAKVVAAKIEKTN